MDRPEFSKIVEGVHKDRMKLMIGKAEDYANEDALANFKRMKVLCRVLGVDPRRSPADCAMFLLLLKLDRWQNLRKKGATPRNESVRDTVMDAHNYLDLAFAASGLDNTEEEAV